MSTRDDTIAIAVDEQRIAGTLVSPTTVMPALLFVHGWGGDQEQHLARAREIAALGCVCLTFDMRGHGQDARQYEMVTREDNLRDVVAAYDALTAHASVDKSKIAVLGSSYGAYLSAIVSSLRPVRWLALRVPALYRDEDWALPKRQLDQRQLATYRRGTVSAQENRALKVCAAFQGDVLIVESQRDERVPHPVIANYIEAFEKAHSLTHRVIKGADHSLSKPEWRQAYTSLLINWVNEMVVGARADEFSSQGHPRLRVLP
jgi:dienelactone hydrolase